MIRRMSSRPREVHILQVDGVDRPGFDIPLDFHATAYGDLTASDHSGAVRLIQPIRYRNIELQADSPEAAFAAGHKTHERVLAKLAELACCDVALIWWRRRPRVIEQARADGGARWRCLMSLATSPNLPAHFWKSIGAVDLGSRYASGDGNGRRL